MIAVLQRVSKASVSVDRAVVGKCGKGLAILLGVADGDTEKDATVLAEKYPSSEYLPMKTTK